MLTGHSVQQVAQHASTPLTEMAWLCYLSHSVSVVMVLHNCRPDKSLKKAYSRACKRREPFQTMLPEPARVLQLAGFCLSADPSVDPRMLSPAVLLPKV